MKRPLTKLVAAQNKLHAGYLDYQRNLGEAQKIPESPEHSSDEKPPVADLEYRSDAWARLQPREMMACPYGERKEMEDANAPKPRKRKRKKKKTPEELEEEARAKEEEEEAAKKAEEEAAAKLAADKKAGKKRV